MMDCREFHESYLHQFFLRSAGPLPEDLRRHLESCSACAEFAKDIARIQHALEPRQLHEPSPELLVALRSIPVREPVSWLAEVRALLPALVPLGIILICGAFVTPQVKLWLDLAAMTISLSLAIYTLAARGSGSSFERVL
jgi:hypothetical protein